MVTLKEQRVEKNDLVEFIQVWRMMKEENPTKEELFVISDRFVRDSSLGSYRLRMDNLQCLSTEIENWISIMKVYEFYSYFTEEYEANIK